jgi:hypothetical protein
MIESGYPKESQLSFELALCGLTRHFKATSLRDTLLQYDGVAL